MQTVVFPSSEGFAPVAPILFTSQLSLSLLMTGCSLGMFAAVRLGTTEETSGNHFHF
jgi:hypothetical protein